MTKTPYDRAREAYADRERKAGRPLRVPHGPAKEHRDKLRALGMTDHRIAELADANGFPIHQTTVTTLDKTSRIHRDTEAGVLSVSLDEAEGCDFKLVSVIGARRAIGALMLKGYSLNWMSLNGVYEQTIDEYAPSNHSYAHALLKGSRQWVRLKTFQRVYGMALKFDAVNPEDLGLSRQVVNRSRNYAAKHGYIPLSCWDEDTIGDPEAIPQWTGACGTPEGRAIHRREDIPMCPACRSPKDNSFVYGVFDPSRLLSYQKRRRLGRREFAEAVHLSPDTVQAYVIGARVPPTATLERLADALRCRPEDLCE